MSETLVERLETGFSVFSCGPLSGSATLGDDTVSHNGCETVVVPDGLASSDIGENINCSPRVRANAQINASTTNLNNCGTIPQANTPPSATPLWSSLFS